jgi:hypothetical protein
MRDYPSKESLSKQSFQSVIAFQAVIASDYLPSRCFIQIQLGCLFKAQFRKDKAPGGIILK